MRILTTLLLCCTLSAAADRQAVLIELGGQLVTFADFLLHLRQINPLMDYDKLPPEEQQRRLDDFIAAKLLAFEARQAGLDRDPEVRARLEYFTDGVLAQAMKDHAAAQLHISEREVADYYRRHREQFRTPERLLLEHLLYKEADQASSARERLSSGAAFADLARQEKPRLLLAERDWFTRETLLPELARAAFALPDGEVSQPVQTSYGFHLLRVVKRDPSRYPELPAVRETIVEKLRQARSADLFRHLLEQARRRAEVRVHAVKAAP